MAMQQSPSPFICCLTRRMSPQRLHTARSESLLRSPRWSMSAVLPLVIFLMPTSLSNAAMAQGAMLVSMVTERTQKQVLQIPPLLHMAQAVQKAHRVDQILLELLSRKHEGTQQQLHQMLVQMEAQQGLPHMLVQMEAPQQLLQMPMRTEEQRLPRMLVQTKPQQRFLRMPAHMEPHRQLLRMLA